MEMEPQERRLILFGENQPLEPSEELVKTICKWVALFAEHFHKEVSEMGMVTYIEGLKDLSIQELNRGCERAFKECASMIHIADIRQRRYGYTIDDTARIFDARQTESGKRGCSVCDFTGWKMIPHPDGHGRQATKCDCRRTLAKPE